MLEEDEEKIEQILFLLDKFCVRDNFYHKLTMTFDGLLRSYLVKQCRDHLNKMCHIDPPQEKHIAAKVSSVGDLFQEHVQDYLHQNPSFGTDDKIQIKINGNGARMTRNSNFIPLSFSILQTEQSVLSAKGNTIPTTCHHLQDPLRKSAKCPLSQKIIIAVTKSHCLTLN